MQEVLTLVTPPDRPCRAIIRALVICGSVIACLHYFENRVAGRIRSTDQSGRRLSAYAVEHTPLAHEPSANTALWKYIFDREAAPIRNLQRHTMAREAPVSAILPSIPLDDIQGLLVRALALHTFVKEIIIMDAWRNNITLPSGVEIRVLDLPGDQRALTAYHICTLAKWDICYVASDGWFNPFLRTLYVNFQEEREMTRSVGIVTLQVDWRVRQANLPWALSGLFISKELARQRAADIAEVALDVHVSQHKHLFEAYLANVADDKIHTQISATLPRLSVKGQLGQSAIYDAAAIDGIKALSRAIKPPRPHLKSSMVHYHSAEDDAKAACYNDECLFYTSLVPQTSLSTLNMHGRYQHDDGVLARNLFRSHKKKGSTSLSTNVDTDSIEKNLLYSAYHLAVDGNVPRVSSAASENITVQSCFRTEAPPQKGDFISLRFLPARPELRTLVIIGSADLAEVLAGDEDMVQQGGWSVWTQAVDRESLLRQISGKPHQIAVDSDRDIYTTTFLIEPPALESDSASPMSRLKLVSGGHGSRPLVLCGWSLDGWTI